MGREVGLAAVVAVLLCLPSHVAAQGAPSRDAARYVDSPFGLEYVFVNVKKHRDPDYVRLYEATGAKWIKFQNVVWKRHEPKPPRKGVHRYVWRVLDEAVRAWQASGFNIQMVLKSKSSWASGDAVVPESKNFMLRSMADKASRAPREEHWVDWEAFVRSVVERYDGDGIEDMPGLRFPILYYEIDSEVQHIPVWGGSPEQYERLLTVAYRAARAANPASRVLLSGVHLARYTLGNPDDATLHRRLEERRATLDANHQALLDRAFGFLDYLFKMKAPYDIIEFHALEGCDVIPGTVAFLRRKTANRGPVPIWAGDVTSEPYWPRDRKKYYRKYIRKKRSKQHKTVYPYFLAEQARTLVRKTVVSLAAGCKKVMMGSLEDYGRFSMWPYNGLVDDDRTPRPAFYSYRMCVDKLEGFQRCERISLEAPDLHAYRFHLPTRSVTVLWSERGERTVKVPFEGAAGWVTPIITEQGRTLSRSQRVSATGGRAEIRLTETPIFLEPASG